MDCEPTAPSMVQPEMPVWSSMDQSRLPPAGRSSERATPVAVIPPTLLTVMVKPIGSPASTAGASATLVISMSAGTGGGHLMSSKSSSAKSLKLASRNEPPPISVMTAAAQASSPAAENGRLMSPGSPGALR